MAIEVETVKAQAESPENWRRGSVEDFVAEGEGSFPERTLKAWSRDMKI